jgi:hypothetical protein
MYYSPDELIKFSYKTLVILYNHFVNTNINGNIISTQINYTKEELCSLLTGQVKRVNYEHLSKSDIVSDLNGKLYRVINPNHVQKGLSGSHPLIYEIDTGLQIVYLQHLTTHLFSLNNSHADYDLSELFNLGKNNDAISLNGKKCLIPSFYVVDKFAYDMIMSAIPTAAIS